jgi:hypothetical protein
MAAGAIKSIQTAVISGATGTTATISSVNTAKAVVSVTGWIGQAVYSGPTDGLAGAYVVLTNATTLTMTTSAASLTGIAVTVVEYY